MTRDYKNVTVPETEPRRKIRDKAKLKVKPKNKQNKVAGKSSADGLPVWFWLVSGVVIGSFVSFLVYLKLSVNVESDVVEAIQKKITIPTHQIAGTKVNIQKEENGKEEIQKEEKSRFEFYSILPERFVDVLMDRAEPEPVSNTAVPNAVEKPTNTKTVQPLRITDTPVIAVESEKREFGGRLYVLQAGSFSRFKEADKRKATLAFMGIASKIHSISKSNKTMYRVRVGPYRDIKKINGIASMLKQNKIPSLLMKVKG